jgi:hypothetical protein
MLQMGNKAKTSWSAWRSAADEVWQTWEEVLAAPSAARRSVYDQHLKALEDERLAADELAAHCRRSVAFALGELEQAA